jgi:hypothetical protein
MQLECYWVSPRGISPELRLCPANVPSLRQRLIVSDCAEGVKLSAPRVVKQNETEPQVRRIVCGSLSRGRSHQDDGTGGAQ